MSFHYLISTGPMEEDWLVAEIYVNEHEQFAELWEWGEKLVIFPRTDGKTWDIPMEEFLEILAKARERVRFLPNNG